MSVVSFSTLFSVILLSVLWFHDVWYPPEDQAENKQWNRFFDAVSGGNKHGHQDSALLPPLYLRKEAESAFSRERMQEAASEEEAFQRWLDDGGTASPSLHLSGVLKA